MLGNVANLLIKSGIEYTCGSSTDFAFDGKFPIAVHTIVTIIKIGIPVLLIIIGMIDLGKAVMAQKEDEIKKGQSLFIKRLIAAILVFLVVYAVQIVVRFVANDTDNADFRSCMNCFINATEQNGKVAGCAQVK